ncbi:transcriptional regulator [Paenibacillus larvae]
MAEQKPQVSTLQAIADYFGKPLYYFTGNDNEEGDIPEWASSKDKRDFKKMLGEDIPIMFDGVPIDDENREKVKRVMEAIFWDAKKKIKESLSMINNRRVGNG